MSSPATLPSNPGHRPGWLTASFLLLLALALASACLWIWARSRPAPPAATTTLADGTRIVLREVQEGTSVRQSYPAHPLHGIGGFLPRAARTRLGIRGSGSLSYCMSSSSTSPIGHYLLVQQIAPGTAVGQAPELSRATLEDADGRFSTSQDTIDFYRFVDPEYPPSTFLCFSVLPRHAQRFRVRLKLKDGREAVLVYPNPRPTPPATGITPTPLPQTQRVGICDATLSRVTTTKSPFPHMLLRNASAEISLREGSSTTTDFRIRQIIFEDEEGNLLTGWAPNTNSPFWKVSATVSPGLSYPFPPADIISLPAVMPQPGKSTPLVLPPELSRMGFTSLVLKPGPSMTALMASSEAYQWLTSGDIMRRLKTPAGWIMVDFWSGGGGSSGGRAHYELTTKIQPGFAVPLPAPGTPFELQFIRTSNITFQFIINPADVTHRAP